jgi:integrase
MGRVLHRLSDVAVRAKKRPGYFADGGNLYLRVAPGGSKGWIFRFSLEGRTRDAGLGAYPTVSLVKAREEAEKWRRLLTAGVDPIQARKAERQTARLSEARTKSFEECAKAYIASHQNGWRNVNTSKLWRSALAIHVYPVLGAEPVSTVDTALVLRVLQPMWVGKPSMASRVRGIIENVLAWAKVQGYRNGENPAQWRGHLDHLLPSRTKVRRVRHHSALPFAEIPAFMGELRARSDLAARVLEFLVLTAARSGEARGVRWDEISLDQRTWIIPGHRMKGGREHRVPLATRAVAILKEMADVRLSDFVFPGLSANRPISNFGMRLLVHELRPGVTIHGFRSSFRDWAAETTSFPNHVVEMALAHAITDGTEAAYRRGDLFEKRRKLMEAWANYCARAPADVLPLLRKVPAVNSRG